MKNASETSVFLGRHVKSLEVATLTSKIKIEQNEKKKTRLLGSIREGRTQGKMLPPRLEGQPWLVWLSG